MSAKPLGALVVGLTFATLLNSKLARAADDQVAEIKGTITLNGKPVPGGRIILFLAGDDQFVGARIREGAYKMSRVPVGRHTVSVEAQDVPPKYASENTSGLTVEILPGMNEILFKLTSR